MTSKFWNFVKNEDGERILRLEGPIDSENFWGDEVTPRAFREELESGEGDITVWINSPGGSVFAAAEIYTMLCDYKGKVTVKIDAIAASAASVVAMAGDRVLMSPVAVLMIHDPMTVATGNAADMEKAISTLNEIKESIINAYARKTGLSHNKISQLMSDETWLSAKKALSLGFIDEIMFTKEIPDEKIEDSWQSYSSRAMGQAILNRITANGNPVADAENNEAASESAVLESVEQPESVKEETVVTTTDKKPDDPDSPSTPVIGLNGKAVDGSMPYELLSKQLEFLR